MAGSAARGPGVSEGWWRDGGRACEPTNVLPHGDATRADSEAWQAVEALLARYVSEETDERRGEVADAFASCWSRRLRVLLMGDGNVVEDTQDDAQGEEMEAVLREVNRGKKYRIEKRKAKMAQRDDDQAMRQALGSVTTSASSASTERVPAWWPHDRNIKR